MASKKQRGHKPPDDDEPLKQMAYERSRQVPLKMCETWKKIKLINAQVCSGFRIVAGRMKKPQTTPHILERWEIPARKPVPVSPYRFHVPGKFLVDFVIKLI